MPAQAAVGAAAGAAATVAMSAVMVAAQRVGLMGTQPPEHITEHALGAVGARPRSEQVENVESTLLHFAFGAGGGALYNLVRRALARRTGGGRRRTWRSVAGGALFGLLVWTVSYQGWVPALRIMPQPEHDRPGRPTAMIAAHLVYGAALGALLRHSSVESHRELEEGTV